MSSSKNIAGVQAKENRFRDQGRQPIVGTLVVSASVQRPSSKQCSKHVDGQYPKARGEGMAETSGGARKRVVPRSMGNLGCGGGGVLER